MSPSQVPLTVSATMVRSHLAVLAVGWFSQNNLPPRELSGYDPLVQELKDLLDEVGDTRWFLLGLEHILLDPDPAVARGFVNARYAYSNEAARSLLLYVLNQLSTGQTPDPAGPATRVQLAEMSRQEWASLRDSQALPQAT